MGLFDDLTKFVGEMSAIGNDMSQLKKEVVTEITTAKQDIQQTIKDTAGEADGTITDIKKTVTQATDLTRNDT